MKYGYARLSTDDQSTTLQLAALKRAGFKTLFKVGQMTLYSCSSTFSQGTHHKFRVGGNDDKKRASSGFRLATPRLPMTNCIH